MDPRVFGVADSVFLNPEPENGIFVFSQRGKKVAPKDQKIVSRSSVSKRVSPESKRISPESKQVKSKVQKTFRWSPRGSDMVLDGPNVDSKVRKAARRASGMVWGPRSKGLSQKMLGC